MCWRLVCVIGGCSESKRAPAQDVADTDGARIDLFEARPRLS
jgi:hypothetical protein